MAFTKKLLLFSLLFVALILTDKIEAELVTDQENDVVPKPEVFDSSVALELENLKSKIALLESSIDERTQQLENKNEHIKQLEKIVEEKSARLASLDREIKSFKEKGTLDAKQQIDKASARATELEKQINILKKEIEGQEKKKDALDTRVNLAEKKIQELNLKLGSLQKINEEQKSRIRKTERALQAAEEEMMNAKKEAALLSKQLSEVHGAWLPGWLEVHYIHYQSVILKYWDKHGKPALDLAIRKALDKKARIEKSVHPHIDRFKAKWVPIIKERSSMVASDVGGHLKALNVKVIDLYHASKSAAEPHIKTVKEVVDPYYQEAKKITKPHIDQVFLVMEPHVSKARIFLKPYTRKMLRTYRKYARKAAAHHHQVATTIHKKLKEHEITKSLAKEELVWYMALAVMVLPVIFFLNLVSGLFRKKPKKRTRSSHSSHTRRKGKRVHSEK